MSGTEATQIQKGSKLKFKGYMKLEEGQSPILAKGEELTVVEVTSDENGVVAKVVNSENIGDTVFVPEEAEVLNGSGTGARTRTRVSDKKTTKKKTTKKASGKKTTKKKTTKKKAGKKAAKKQEDPITVTNTEQVEAAIQKDGGDAIKAAIGLVQKAEEVFITLGGVLAHVYHENLAEKAGYGQGREAFTKFVEDTLEIKYRKAMHLIAIYLWSVKLGLTEADLAEIGWSKAKEMVTLCDTKTKARKALAYAKQHGRREVADYVRTTWGSAEAGGAGEGAAATRQVQKTVYKFSLFADQAVTVNAAFKRAKELEGVSDDAAAFAYIVTEWSTLTEGVEVPKADAIKGVEARYGIQLAEVEE